MDSTLLDELTSSIPELKISNEINIGGQKVVYSSLYKDSINTVFKVIEVKNSDEKARAIREIQILSALSADCFPKLYNYGEYSKNNSNILYIIEEYVSGQNLRDKMNSIKPACIPIIECKKILSALFDTLLILEKKHLIHRDIKPENIIVSNDRIVLVDFGIARDIKQKSLTETYAVFGPMTPGYAPPEQIRNEKRKISFRTDLFSFAVLFYEMLTGKNPFFVGASSVNEILTRTLSLEPQPLISMGFNSTFDGFILKCLEKNCHRRPASLIHAKMLFDKIIWEV